MKCSLFCPVVREFLICKFSSNLLKNRSYLHRFVPSLSAIPNRFVVGWSTNNTNYNNPTLATSSIDPVISQDICGSDCPCVGNTFLWHVQNMQSLRGGGVNDDLVKVYNREDTEKIRIVMQIYGSERTVVRPRNEPLSKSLDRIKTNVKNANAKLVKKMKKKAKKVENNGDSSQELLQASPTASLLDKSGKEIDVEADVVEAWSNATDLKICDILYRVIYNPPGVESAKLVRRPIVGIPIYPQLQLVFAKPEFTRFEWFRRPYQDLEEASEEDSKMEIGDQCDTSSNKLKRDFSDAESSACEEELATNWEPVGNDQTYTPTLEDIDFEIRLLITPGSDKFKVDQKDSICSAQAESVTTGNPVKKIEEKFLFADRIKLTEEKCGDNRFRMVSYNVLADVYASTDYAQNFLFPYCPVEAMDINYRQQLMIKEISGYNADIICLQEVDRSVFESYYMPVMSLQGFAGVFAAKDGLKEGVALFYIKDRFKLKMANNIILRQALKEERNKDLLEKISENKDFLKNFRSKPTCLLAAVLESRECSKQLLIGNTHLYWHPRGCHVRLIQMEIILRELRRLYAEHSENADLSCLLLGDMNSHPHSATVQLVTKGFVAPNHSDWYSMGKAELIPDISLCNSTLFKSACGYPNYTTLVTSFQGCLDYIFLDDSLDVEKVIPQPPHDDIVKHCAMPNVSTPSDHIAQVVELSWKPG